MKCPLCDLKPLINANVCANPNHAGEPLVRALEAPWRVWLVNAFACGIGLGLVEIMFRH